MPTYTIEAHLTKKQLTDMDKGNYSLCLAKVVNTDSVTDQGPIPVSNVIAASYSPGAYSNNSLFQWEEIYGMAANSTTYPQGTVILETSTDIYSPLEFKSLLEIEDWANADVVANSPAVEDGSFGFNPVKFDGVCVLYLATKQPVGITPQGSPCYTTPSLFPHGPNNVEQITPSESVEVFFEKNGRSGALKTRSTLYTTRFDLKSETPLVIDLDTTLGKWVPRSG